MFLIRNLLFYELDSACLILLSIFKYRFPAQTENRWDESRLRAHHCQKYNNSLQQETRRKRRRCWNMSFSLRLESGVTAPRDGNAISGNSRLRSDGASRFTRAKKNKFHSIRLLLLLPWWYSIKGREKQFRNFESKCNCSLWLRFPGYFVLFFF